MCREGRTSLLPDAAPSQRSISNLIRRSHPRCSRPSTFCCRAARERPGGPAAFTWGAAPPRLASRGGPPGSVAADRDCLCQQIDRLAADRLEADDEVVDAEPFVAVYPAGQLVGIGQLAVHA